MCVTQSVSQMKSSRARARVGRDFHISFTPNIASASLRNEVVRRKRHSLVLTESCTGTICASRSYRSSELLTIVIREHVPQIGAVA
jgi:hypothetical protein